jgi:hypothetical protein
LHTNCWDALAASSDAATCAFFSATCAHGKARRFSLVGAMYRNRVATRPVHLDSALQEAVNRAREAIASSGQLRPNPGPYTSPLSEQERRAVAALLHDGTYRQLVDAVAANDPDIADL